MVRKTKKDQWLQRMGLGEKEEKKRKIVLVRLIRNPRAKAAYCRSPVLYGKGPALGSLCHLVSDREQTGNWGISPNTVDSKHRSWSHPLLLSLSADLSGAQGVAISS